MSNPFKLAAAPAGVLAVFLSLGWMAVWMMHGERLDLLAFGQALAVGTLMAAVALPGIAAVCAAMLAMTRRLRGTQPGYLRRPASRTGTR